jgi:hypothetical protein
MSPTPYALGLLAGCLVAGSAGAAFAAQAVPDITGSWDYRGRVEANRDSNPPPAKPEVQARLDKKREAGKTGFVRGVSNILCLPTGFPAMMQWKSPIEILQTKGKVTVLSEHDPGNDEPRTIYLNRAMPDEPDPSWNGYSVGKWEGPVLVVQTAGLNDRASVFGLPRGATTKVTERFHLEDGGKTLIDAVTVEDPRTLTKPWTVTLKYDRMPEDTERYEAVCEPDLEALKGVDLAAIKDIDVEAARLLDPDLAYNPGAK